jgi:hypothetical protein
MMASYRKSEIRLDETEAANPNARMPKSNLGASGIKIGIREF